MKTPRLLRGPLGDDLAAALPGWIVARLAVSVGYMIAVLASDELRSNHTLQLRQGLFSWDAAWYRDIAAHGYDGVAREGLRFFPLVPVAARVLSVSLFGEVGVALIVLVNVAALGAGMALHRLMREETGNRARAARAAWLMTLLPPAVVLVLGYAEAVAMLLVITAFLMLRRRRWLAAALVGALAGLCRPTGMLLAIPALVEVARGWNVASDRPRRIAAVLGAPVGTAMYLAWVGWRYHDWELPIRLQNRADLRGGWDDPIHAVWGSAKALFSDGRIGDGLHLPWIGVFAVLLVVVFLKLPASYGLFSTAVLGMALSAHNLGSFERYGLFAFPLVMALAMLTDEERIERALLVACGATLAGFTTLIFLGTFVP